jgi:COP9 signalosome complex subunit 3
MDDLLPVLLSFPPHPPPRKSLSDRQYEEGIKPLIEGLRNTPSKQLLQPTSSGENLLNVSYIEDIPKPELINSRS